MWTWKASPTIFPPSTMSQVGTGRGITPEEARRHAPVVFIGNDLRDRFFPGVDPIDKTIQIEGKPYQVVGVAKELGSVFGNSQDNFVMIPVESYFKTYGAHTGIRLIAKAIDQEHLAEAQDEIRVLMRAYRHLGPAQDDNFSIFASEAFVTLLGTAHVRPSPPWPSASSRSSWWSAAS